LNDRINPPCHGRCLASHIPGARYFEQPGDYSLRFASSGDSDALYGEIVDFLSATPDRREPERVLTTILLVRSAGTAGRGASYRRECAACGDHNPAAVRPKAPGCRARQPTRPKDYDQRLVRSLSQE
jgi:hypothetical protein